MPKTLNPTSSALESHSKLADQSSVDTVLLSCTASCVASHSSNKAFNSDCLSHNFTWRSSNAWIWAEKSNSQVNGRINTYNSDMNVHANKAMCRDLYNCCSFSNDFAVYDDHSSRNLKHSEPNLPLKTSGFFNKW